ncbi:cilia- and flagella-associated protein 97 [Cephus cinctus]|uniref:Cilia- and flagella-associated protein 97 n=1 Tax=Cephus cinctus TaxID=211228 RepID=A0AAJ7FMQ8_CEPCN|nr:cilia- and flagella-associated protein 97 [Cephus cinctus]
MDNTEELELETSRNLDSNDDNKERQIDHQASLQKADADNLDEKSDYKSESFCSDDSYQEESEMTNVTLRSSLSDCSSFRTTTQQRRQIRSNSRIEEDLQSLEDDVKLLRLTEESRLDIRQLRSGRRNMSFSNEEMRKIERENQLLLRKIMSHHKPQVKNVASQSAIGRTSSSAINRRKLQRKIQEDNMMLLRRIQQTKSCALPRTTPGYRMTFI